MKVPSQFKTDKFLKLKEVWYKRLGKTGFKDLEKRIVNASSELNDLYFFKSGIDETVTEYYAWAHANLESGKFKNERDKLIWSLHCEAISNAEIGRKLGLTRWPVLRRIQAMKASFNKKPK